MHNGSICLCIHEKIHVFIYIYIHTPTCIHMYLSIYIYTHRDVQNDSIYIYTRRYVQPDSIYIYPHRYVQPDSTYIYTHRYECTNKYMYSSMYICTHRIHDFLLRSRNMWTKNKTYTQIYLPRLNRKSCILCVHVNIDEYIYLLVPQFSVET